MINFYNFLTIGSFLYSHANKQLKPKTKNHNINKYMGQPFVIKESNGNKLLNNLINKVCNAYIPIEYSATHVNNVFSQPSIRVLTNNQNAQILQRTEKGDAKL